MRLKKKRRGTIHQRKFRPAQVLAVSFLLVILAGALLLCMPFSARSGRASFVDALFTSTSAVCVTGLIVQDTGTFFSPAGQILILILIQLGGLGIITFSTMILLAAGREISIRDQLVIQDGFLPTAAKDFPSLVKNVFLYTFVIEMVGACSLYFRFAKDFPPDRSLALAVFHAVSAFCNAGFSLFSNNLMSFRGDVWVNLTIVLLIVLGGLGFLVQQEVFYFFAFFFRRRKPRLRLHTKLILTVTAVLIILSFLAFLALEWHGSLRTLPIKEKALASLFHVVTPRTAGFHTIDLSTCGMAAIFLLLLLMFIGASPGSTGGGVKTSTAGVIFAFLRSKISARGPVHLFWRSLSEATVLKAFTLISLALGLVFISSFVLVLSQPELSMRNAVFEVFSAFGTVGLSLGITFNLTAVGKLMLIVTMYIGRIGPLTLLLAFSLQKSRGKFAYVEESVMIG